MLSAPTHPRPAPFETQRSRCVSHQDTAKQRPGGRRPGIARVDRLGRIRQRGRAMPRAARRRPRGLTSRQPANYSASVPVGLLTELLSLALCLVSGEAIALLKLPGELLAVSFQLREVVVSELAPLLFDLAFDFVPSACNAIVVHYLTP